VLASGHWYTSGTTIGITGIVFAVVAIIVAVALWKIGPPRRRLYYGITSDTPLLSQRLPDQPETRLEVTVGGRPVGNPHVIAFWAQNWSRTDIRAAEFENGTPLVFDLGAPIIHLLDRAKLLEEWPALNLTYEGTRIVIAPIRLPRRKLMEVGILTDGHTNLSCATEIDDCDLREIAGGPSSRSRAAQETLVMYILGFVIGLALIGVGLGGIYDIPPVAVGSGTVGVVAVFTAATLRIQQLLRRRRAH
jgi:hypothetical protein